MTYESNYVKNDLVYNGVLIEKLNTLQFKVEISISGKFFDYPTHFNK